MHQKPLAYAFQHRRDKCSPRQFRHLELIEQFSTDFRHISGQYNVVADALMRSYSVMMRLDFHALASSQDQSAELQDILKNGPALLLECVPIPGTDIHLYFDTSYSTAVAIHNHSFQTPGFDILHGLSQPGANANATATLVSQRFLWPVVGKNCRARTRTLHPANVPR